MILMVGPYEREVKRFVKAASWLEASDDLALHHLKTIARSLDKQLEEDGRIQSALANVFGVTLRDLEKRRPKADTSEDEGDDLHFS